MKGIINTILISAASVLLLSCGREDSFDAPMNESIVLDLSSGLTKATVKEDNIMVFWRQLSLIQQTIITI